jgi:NhaP-type Na+/H+ or K+/H+ antiporter
VFGLLAYNALPDDEGNLVLLLTVVTVVGSVLLHGVAAPLLLRRGRAEAVTAEAVTSEGVIPTDE